jgi:PAS domain S-box-containing protein
MKDKTPKRDAVGADRYRALFDNSADAILMMEEHRFVDCNHAAVEMLRYKDKNALLQCHPSELSPEFQPDGQRSFDKANKILANVVNCCSQRFEWVHVKSDGELFTVEVLMTAIPADGSYTLHITWHDISERKRLEKQLRHSQKMEALGNLAGGIAHDFNNTLVPIVTYSDLLARVLQDQPEHQEWAREISRAGMLAASLVKKLLTVSRKDERLPVILDLEETTANALGMLRKLIGEDIRVNFEGTGDTLWVETDPGDIEQILLNLASNARDALPTGGEISVTLSKVQHSQCAYARLAFTDDGAGMDAETLEQVFVPFFTTKELGSGTGLGPHPGHIFVRLHRRPLGRPWL